MEAERRSKKPTQQTEATRQVGEETSSPRRGPPPLPPSFLGSAAPRALPDQGFPVASKEDIVALERKEESAELARMKALSAEKRQCEDDACRDAIVEKQKALEAASEQREAAVAEAVSEQPATIEPLPIANCSFPETDAAIAALPKLQELAEKTARTIESWETELTEVKKPVDDFLHSVDSLVSIEDGFAKIYRVVGHFEIIPKIGTVLTRVKAAALSPIKKILSRIKAPLTSLRAKLDKGRAKMDAVAAKFEKARQRLIELAGKCEKGSNVLRVMKGRVNVEGCNDTGTVEGLASGLNLAAGEKLLGKLMSMTLQMGAVSKMRFSKIREGLRKVGNPMKKVGKVLGKLERVLQTKIPILVPKIAFKVIRVFGKRIKIPYPTKQKKTFTPQMILNTLGKLGALKKILEKVALAPLTPLMRMIEKQIGKPFQAIQRKISGVAEKLSGFGNKAISGLSELSGFKSKLEKIHPLTDSLNNLRD